MNLPLSKLENAIHYQFHNIELLRQALTHSSFTNELNVKNHHLLCNERLEFLGDSILEIISSEYLYNAHQDFPEGDLTNLRSLIVCEDALASYARKLNFGDYLRLGKGEALTGGAEKPAILADAFEAVIAAIFIDAGGMEGIAKVQEFLIPFLKEGANAVQYTAYTNFKSQLQEFAQDNHSSLDYKELGESGPDHAKSFTFEVYMDGNRVGIGMGASKQKAQQAAAKDALHLFGIIK